MDSTLYIAKAKKIDSKSIFYIDYCIRLLYVIANINQKLESTTNKKMFCFVVYNILYLQFIHKKVPTDALKN